MEDSILKSTKAMLGLGEDYTAFDIEIITHINATSSHLKQLGVGTAIIIEDDNDKWSDFGLSQTLLNVVRSFVFFKVKLAFDPPGTSYAIESLKDMIKEQEWRLTELAQEEVGA